MNNPPPQSIRLFFALWPDATTRTGMMALQQSIRGRIIPYDNLHMTLAFLGQQPASLLPRLNDILTHLPRVDIRISLDRLGYFPRNRVAWLGTHQVPDELNMLQKALVAALEQEGVALDSKEFRPHVTLARDATLPPDVTFTPIEWAATEMAIVQSMTLPEGSVYKVVARRPLERDIWIPGAL